MPLDLIVYQVDSFTTRLLEGNPAGVVLNADGLDETLMRRIAREMNKSETAFIFDKPGEGYDIEVRFFTPTREVPICGHATIAALYVYARERGIESGVVRQKTKAGILPVEIVPEDGDRRIVMTQARPEFGMELEGEPKADLLAGLGIDAVRLDPSLPVQIVSTGHSKVLVPIGSKDTLGALSIDGPALSRLSAQIGCNGYYAFTLDSREAGVLASGRMFAPAIGIAEDPVTGNANGPLGAYLARHGRIPRSGEGHAFTITQGEAVDRKGYMDVMVYCRGEEPELVKIGGRARIAFKTVMTL